jgi:hypothetical protein
MKIYFKSRTAQRAYKGKGKKVDLGAGAVKRWAVDIKR